MPGSVRPEGITFPPIDNLLQRSDSKYSLVIYAAKRARQINAYYSQLGEGLLEYVGPLVETHVQEKPLSIAMREIDAGLLTSETFDPAAEAEAAAAPPRRRPAAQPRAAEPEARPADPRPGAGTRPTGGTTARTPRSTASEETPVRPRTVRRDPENE